MVTFIVGRHLGKKFIQRVLKINASTKILVERLCDFKIYAISVLSFAPYAHLIKLLSMLRLMPLSVQLQDRTTLNLQIFLELGQCAVLVLT